MSDIDKTRFRNLLSMKGVIAEIGLKANEIVAGKRKAVPMGVEELLGKVNELMALMQINQSLGMKAMEEAKPKEDPPEEPKPKPKKK